MDTFTRAYITAALWSSTDDNDRPMDEKYGADNIAPNTLAKMETDCAAFQTANADDIGTELEQAGIDFWLTRNGHGAGFWDGDWPEPAATRLTDAAHACGEVGLYVGDDEWIYG